MQLNHTVAEIATLLGGRVLGDPERPLTGLRSLDAAGPQDLAAVFRLDAAPDAWRSRAGALLVPPGAEIDAGPGRSLIALADPEAGIDFLTERFGPDPADPEPGVHPLAHVEDGAEVDPTAAVGPWAFVGRGARVGAGTRLWARSFVGAEARVGSDCRIFPGVFIGPRCTLGDRVIVHANAVIGSDGFGYRAGDGGFIKSPQVGTVVLADDVEIGACTTIDRARLEATRVERGAKIDNQVHLAHNCVVGEHSAVAAQSGMAGRASLGKGVQVAGHCAINGGAHVADGTILGGMTGIMTDTKPGQFLVGFPAYPKKEWARLQVALRRAPDVLANLKNEKGKASRDAGEDARDS